MRDLHKSIDYIERGLLRGLERTSTPSPPKERPKLSIRAWRAPVTSNTDAVYPIEQVFRPKNKLKAQPKDTPRDTSMPQLTLTARALKITVPLEVAEVAALPAPDGQARSKLAITCEGKVYTAACLFADCP
jgi:hypothetical protein